MLEYSLIETLAAGGPVAILALIIYLMYRKDRNNTERMWRDSKRSTDEMVRRDQDTREANTKALTELNVLLRKINGRGRDGK